MSEERGDLILEHLGAIRNDIGDLKTSIVEVKERLGFSKRNTPAFRAASTGSTVVSSASSGGSISSRPEPQATGPSKKKPAPSGAPTEM
jgi:hypothetical protein